MLHMQLREVTRIPNRTANRKGNFTVMSGVTLDLGGTDMRGPQSLLEHAAGEMQTDLLFKEPTFGFPFNAAMKCANHYVSIGSKI